MIKLWKLCVDHETYYDMNMKHHSFTINFDWNERSECIIKRVNRVGRSVGWLWMLYLNEQAKQQVKSQEITFPFFHMLEQ